MIKKTFNVNRSIDYFGVKLRFVEYGEPVHDPVTQVPSYPNKVITNVKAIQKKVTQFQIINSGGKYTDKTTSFVVKKKETFSIGDSFINTDNNNEYEIINVEHEPNRNILFCNLIKNEN